MRRQSSVTLAGVNSGTPVNEKLCGKYIQTFAYYTIKDRLPVILTKIIDHLSRDKEELIKKYGQEAEEDIKGAIGKISKLKNEVQTNKPLIDIESTADDVEDWNKYLSTLEGEETVCWFHSPWLYTETYMYRRIWEIFENSKTLQHFDPFRKQKEEAFEASMGQLSAIASTILQNDGNSDPKKVTSLALKMSLWSNRCDLSLSNGSIVAQGESLNLKTLDSFLLADDTEKAVELLSNVSSKIVDIVHDNAALELFSDLCLADHLIVSGIAQTVRLRVKRMPWYVSDAIAEDIEWLLSRLPEVKLQVVADRWREYLKSGQWQIIVDKYWTTPFPYSEMPKRDPALYSSLSEAFMVIFKGDLNYRKLLGDVNWSFSEPLATVLGPFRPTNVLALRTIKSDLVCGLQPGRTEVLFQKEPLWMRSGDYGIIQLSEALV